MLVSLVIRVEVTSSIQILKLNGGLILKFAVQGAKYMLLLLPLTIFSLFAVARRRYLNTIFAFWLMAIELCGCWPIRRGDLIDPLNAP